MEILRTAGKEVIRREHEHFREAGIDDARHIPRIQRIASAVVKAAREAGVPDEEADALREELVTYGRELWLDLCVENLREDDLDREEDVDAYREESREIFDNIWTADDPWSVYR